MSLFFARQPAAEARDISMADWIRGIDGSGKTKAGETVHTANGVYVVGPTHLASMGCIHASEMYARNLYNFLSAYWDKEAGRPVLPDDDEVTIGIRLTKDGKVVNERLLG